MKLSDKGILIRRTVEADLPQIYAEGIGETHFQNLPFAFNPDNLADIFASENSICFTAVRKKKVLGFITGSATGDELTVYWIMVKDKIRRAGIGKELLKRCIDESKKSGTEKIFIAVFRNNAESVKFFTDNGFIVNESFIGLKLMPNKD